MGPQTHAGAGNEQRPGRELTAAAKLVLAASSEDLRRQETDEWWRERRLLARGLIDRGEAETAYRAANEAAPPKKRSSGSRMLLSLLTGNCLNINLGAMVTRSLVLVSTIPVVSGGVAID
jgi:hypothetical protein